MCIIESPGSFGCRRFWWPTALVWMMLLSVTHTVAQQPRSRQDQRAPRPDWIQRDTSDIFFVDAFVEALQGARPAHLQPDAPREPAGRVGALESQTMAESRKTRWSRLISAETLHSQIKTIVQGLQQSVTSPARFAGGDFKLARQQFVHAATLLKVVSLYDGSIKWKSTAYAASQRCTAAAAGCQDGSRKTYTIAKQARDHLLDMLNGSELEPIEQSTTWDVVADRAVWMRWIDKASTKRIKSLVGTATNVKSGSESIIMDAEMLQLIAHVLAQEEMEDGLDADYRALCNELGAAAAQLKSAAQDGSHERAAKAANQIQKSCADCHEAYRG